MTLTRRIIFMALLVLLFPTHSSATTFGFHTFTWHQKGYKCSYGVNPGAYVIFDNGLSLGAYHNSCERPTFYAGYNYDIHPTLRVFALAMTGYKQSDPDHVRLVLASAKRVYHWPQYHTDLRVIVGIQPQYKPYPILVHFMLERKF